MKIQFAVITATLLFATQAFAGTVFQTLTVEADGTETNGTMSVQDGNLLIEMREQSEDVTLIYKQDESTMITVSHAEKSYMVMDKAFIDRIAVQMAAVQKQMEDMMKNVPPEQREMMEKMMSGQMPQLNAAVPEVDVVRLGDGGTVNGKSTVRYQVTYDGQPKQNLWIAGWDQMEGAEDLKSSFLSMADFMQSIIDQVPMVAANMENPMQALKKLDGFPIRTEDLDDQGRVKSTTDVLSSTTEDLSAGAFEAPDGYKKQEMPGLSI